MLVSGTWAEQRIFDEDEDQQVPSLGTPHDMRHILEAHASDGNCRAIVLLGELSHASHLMAAAPFSYRSRQPKETQIYKFAKESEAGLGTPTFLGTYTPKNFVAPKAPQARHGPDDLRSRMPSRSVDHKRQKVNNRGSGLTARQMREYEEMEDVYVV